LQGFKGVENRKAGDKGAIILEHNQLPFIMSRQCHYQTLSVTTAKLPDHHSRYFPDRFQLPENASSRLTQLQDQMQECLVLRFG